MLPQPTLVLQEFVRCLKSSGAIALINPSELMSIASALHLSDERRLNGINRSSLINYAQLAESHSRWSEADLKNLFARSGLNLVKSELQMGSGLVRFALAEISPAA